MQICRGIVQVAYCRSVFTVVIGKCLYAVIGQVSVVYFRLGHYFECIPQPQKHYSEYLFILLYVAKKIVVGQVDVQTGHFNNDSGFTKIGTSQTFH